MAHCKRVTENGTAEALRHALQRLQTASQRLAEAMYGGVGGGGGADGSDGPGAGDPLP